jgi:glycosyltransferase involved in cell wall biosynthesis
MTYYANNSGKSYQISSLELLLFFQNCCTLLQMRLIYIADGRSPIAINWIYYFIHTGHEVHLVSTFPCQPIAGLTSLVVIPVALSGLYGQSEIRSRDRGRLLRKVLPVALRTRIRQLVAPLSFPRAANSLREVINQLQPDLIHAMRIPYEGMIASIALRHNMEGNIKSPPFVISVWGNDFTLHAKSTQLMANHTHQTLQDCDGLHTDCQRDMKLARELGFASTKPGMVLPGGGGVKLDVFYPAEKGQEDDGNKLIMDTPAVTIINPRGFRAYVRNDTFFQAIPLVLKDYPDVRFVCTGMAGEAQAQRWKAELGIGEQTELLPAQTHQEMAELFRQSQISLSITTHDGTPNTLLEAMACGCFPIAGDLESLREWIIPGINGLLVDPGDPNALATAIHTAISKPELRWQARERNIQLIKQRAEYVKTMQVAEEFYQQLISQSQGRT